jgi:hypothetical protein
MFEPEPLASQEAARSREVEEPSAVWDNEVLVGGGSRKGGKIL